ncbi:hypothetical protein ESOMN_v1c01070 [Williamsoniiplasma somnilux]|uniref:Uncharacterized protein n=1 Tax=Williamsoniiplasma somnilux TaxID=215578 RepID=A0A2K8NXC5_9MOLU|nr:hypothetical protein [Williamsoniiplasma somnilux]ATZ18492.1 hypothetical protein ESOMN_v1c01070 [Williamsoniiplasma somnilux]
MKTILQKFNLIYFKTNYVKKRRRAYKTFLGSYMLETKQFNYASEVDKKNILLKNFNFLIRLNGQKEDEYIDHMNVIRLLSSELFYLSTNNIDAEVAIQLDETVADILNNLNLISVSENLEAEIIRDLKFTPEERLQYFDYNKVYSNIATTFSAPFIQSSHFYSYYVYGYYLSMFLNLHYFANKELVLEKNSLFLAKLKIQNKMIDAIRTITPEEFNTFILRTNTWISKINFKKLNKGVSK